MAVHVFAKLGKLVVVLIVAKKLFRKMVLMGKMLCEG